MKCAVHNQLCIIVKNVYVLDFFLPCRSCLQNISFVNLKPHQAELINEMCCTQPIVYNSHICKCIVAYLLNHTTRANLIN